MTSAPSHARSCVQDGPASNCVKSTTRTRQAQLGPGLRRSPCAPQDLVAQLTELRSCAGLLAGRSHVRLSTAGCFLRVSAPTTLHPERRWVTNEDIRFRLATQTIDKSITSVDNLLITSEAPLRTRGVHRQEGEADLASVDANAFGGGLRGLLQDVVDETGLLHRTAAQLLCERPFGP